MAMTIIRMRGPHHRCFSSGSLLLKQILAHKVYESATLPENASKSPLLITHGILGSTANFRTIAKALSKATSRKVIVFDARNHGDSPHIDEMSYHLMAEDVVQFVNDLQISSFATMGHSMGGRTAMTYALKYPERLEKLIVVDVSPISLSRDFVEMKGIIEAMNAIRFDSKVKLSEARKIANDQLKSVSNSYNLRAFFVSNLAVDKKQNIYWKLNLQNLLNNLDNIKDFPQELMDSKLFTKPALFIKGERSSYIPESDFPLIMKTFTNATFQVMQDSGHMPYADNPSVFLKHVIGFLNP